MAHESEWGCTVAGGVSTFLPGRSHGSKVTLTPSSPGGAGVLDTAPGAALTPELWGKGSL